jgi:hypothetical protein
MHWNATQSTSLPAPGAEQIRITVPYKLSGQHKIPALLKTLSSL